MPFTYEKIQYLREDCIEITGFDGSVRSLTIPDRLDGLPVRSIGKHAFAGRKDLREAVLPQSIKRLCLFAFHNCTALRRMSLYDSVEDYYDGVIRQCTALEEIEIRLSGESYAIVKDMLSDNDHAMSFRLLLPEEEIRLSSSLIAKMFPRELEGKTEDELYGVGMISYLPFESQVIEIADDGRTAKGIWNVRGSTSRLTAAGPVANWIFGWAAVDFVLEDGEWKILNLLLLYNVDHQCGVGFTEPEKVFEPVPGFAPMADFHLPEPNVPMTVMETFRPDRPRTRSPRCPEPYATFADTFSYGI